MKRLVVLAVLVLQACAIRYVAPDGREASEREVNECKYESSKAAIRRDGVNAASIYGLVNNRAHDEQYIMSQCMNLKGGYKPTL